MQHFKFLRLDFQEAYKKRDTLFERIEKIEDCFVLRAKKAKDRPNLRRSTSSSKKSPPLRSSDRVEDRHGPRSGMGVHVTLRKCPRRVLGGFKPNPKPFQGGGGLKPETRKGFRFGLKRTPL